MVEGDWRRGDSRGGGKSEGLGLCREGQCQGAVEGTAEKVPELGTWLLKALNVSLL